MKAIAGIWFAAALSLAIPAVAAKPPMETAVLAGGCYWGMDSVFEHVKGVERVDSGWAGGNAQIPHAEAVKIRFDPAQITYGQLLQIYFTVAHDPTQVNRQGPDVGVNYRSAIFPQNAQQKSIAEQMVERANKAFHRPIATKLETGPFESAPPDQQHFARKHPTFPYIVINDEPKLKQLKARYPQWWKD
jgi:peptide-methionine (S)-S-oxide reductase